MNREKISRLEELLARVQTRAAEPRAQTNGGAVAQPLAQPTVAHATSAPATSPPASGGAVAGAFDTSPPPTTAEPDNSDVDVEVTSEVVDIDVDVDMDDMGMPLESGAQPVAEHSYADDTTAEPIAPAQEAMDEQHAEELAAAPPPAANEIEEPAPSSSPRPIASEQPQAFEEESAPRHTPPPESGKQVAAAPSAPPAQKPPPVSAPPPSLEGHTLIGGWREPGLPREARERALAQAQGVRVPAPAPSGQEPNKVVGGGATRTSAPPAMGTAHIVEPLQADVTKAELPGSAQVASFQGAVPTFKPSTFGDLLEATLSL